MDHLYPHKSTYLPPQLRQIREHLRLNPFEFGEACGLSNTTINRIEKSRSPVIKLMTWNKINMFLQRIDYFNKRHLPVHELLKNRHCYYSGPVTDAVTAQIVPVIRSFWQPINFTTQVS